MATQLLDIDAFPGVTYTDLDDGRDTFAEDGPGQERTLRAGGIACRVYSWPQKAFPEDALDVQAFQAARLLAGESFYVQDPWDSARTDVDVGPAVGSQSVFSLPTDDEDEEYRDYPISGTVTAKVNGSTVSVASVNTDARTVTLAVAASDGDTVTISYEAYRLCRFGPRVEWSAEDADWYVGNLEIREVMRDP